MHVHVKDMQQIYNRAITVENVTEINMTQYIPITSKKKTLIDIGP